MTSKWIARAAWILIALGAGTGGFVAGRSRQIEAAIQMLQVEAGGNLVQRVETLSLLHLGDVAAAIAGLEREADGLTVSIGAHPGADPRALAYMKTYLSVVPPDASRAGALAAALTGIATLEPGQCETALRALLLSAKRDADQSPLRTR